jgi:DeoR family transcriptional regulator of aga operon
MTQRNSLSASAAGPSPTHAGAELIPAERQARILELVRRDGATSIQRVAAIMGASPSTIRRDLDSLTKQGYLERTHGGAVLTPRLRSTFEPTPDISARVEHAAKAAIGAAAARLVEEGQSVILDSSSTVLEAARELAARDIAITAVTNDLRIAETLGRSPRARVLVLGGLVRPGSPTLTGEPGYGFAAGLHADIAFIGIHSLAQFRLSDTSVEVSQMKRALIRAARRVVLLADSSKFAYPAFCEVCGIEAIGALISDTRLAAEHRLALEQRNVTVTLVEPEGAAANGEKRKAS